MECTCHQDLHVHSSLAPEEPHQEPGLPAGPLLALAGSSAAEAPSTA